MLVGALGLALAAWRGDVWCIGVAIGFVFSQLRHVVLRGAMIVTTQHGRYRVEETARGWFVVTTLAGGLQPNGPTPTVRRAPIRLGVGVGWC